jgi:HopA1 effector protein family
VSRYREQIAAALRAVTIRGPTRYAWLGRASRPLPAELEAQLDEAARRAYLVSCVGEELYWSFYCRGRPVPARWGEPEPVAPDPWLIEALSEANTGGGSWERGWTVERVEEREVVAATPWVRARIPRRDCRAPAGLRPGAAVSVRLPKELPSLSPGFYTAVGDAPADVESPPGVVRAYWHVTRAGAPALMRALTARLNTTSVPFRLKVADHPFRLDRCDAVVLYLTAEGLDAVRATLLGVAAELTAHLRPWIPVFTLELAPGVGLAEDDGGAESFGTRRCRLLAEGILRAHARGLTAIAARIAAVAGRFAEDGVRIDAPYRDPSLSGRHVL